ncbi:SatD family protein [Gulosibacter bifidus]|uniref:SatD family protein n=1 Tax=Gulosibacter bifidus TaxID=272239 RepID=A0ABW5RIC8_9MICO|nr:SatD family protein [Gulosibacter bifidus]
MSDTYPSCVALLVDIIGSRGDHRARNHQAMLRAIDQVNETHPALDPLRTTVGDEVQGIYATLGDALTAAFALRFAAASPEQHEPIALRFGVGGGEVTVVDADRGIQDGSAWWAARDAINQVESLAELTHYDCVRTLVIDRRTEAANGTVNAALQLIDAQMDALRPASQHSLGYIVAGLSNQDAATKLGISASANSQRAVHNRLRILADAITQLGELP